MTCAYGGRALLTGGAPCKVCGTFSHVKLYRVMEGMVSPMPSERDYSHPSYWKVPVKPADNRALESLVEARRVANPGTRVSAADVVRSAVHEALSAVCDPSHCYGCECERPSGGSDV